VNKLRTSVKGNSRGRLRPATERRDRNAQEGLRTLSNSTNPTTKNRNRGKIEGNQRDDKGPLGRLAGIFRGGRSLYALIRRKERKSGEGSPGLSLLERIQINVGS